MLRFVILEHDSPYLHWDLMLEVGEILKTWRLQKEPEPGKVIPSEASFDHRKKYLDYEGPVSGNRGHVTRWDAGTYVGEWCDPKPGDEIAIQMEGNRLRGTAILKWVEESQWTLEVRTRNS